VGVVVVVVVVVAIGAAVMVVAVGFATGDAALGSGDVGAIVGTAVGHFKDSMAALQLETAESQASSRKIN